MYHVRLPVCSMRWPEFDCLVRGLLGRPESLLARYFAPKNDDASDPADEGG